MRRWPRRTVVETSDVMMSDNFWYNPLQRWAYVETNYARRRVNDQRKGRAYAQLLCNRPQGWHHRSAQLTWVRRPGVHAPPLCYPASPPGCPARLESPSLPTSTAAASSVSRSTRTPACTLAWPPIDPGNFGCEKRKQHSNITLGC